MRGAARSASTDSKSGTSDSGSLESSRTRSTSSADVVPDTITVPSACSPCRSRAARDRVEEPADARLGIDEVARVHADVEPGEVQPEDLHAPAQRGERPVGDPRAAVRAQAAVEQREILRQPVDRVVRVGVEAAPHERELPAIRLVEILVADLRRVLGQLPLVARDRLEELRVDVDEARRDADRGGERAHLVAVPHAQQRARAFERLGDRLGAGVRVAVGVAADPRAEAKRRRRVRAGAAR